MLLASRKHWIQLAILSTLLLLSAACASDDGPGFEVSGVYTRLSRWGDGEFSGADRSISLSTDGTATRFRSGCPQPEVGNSDLTWKLEGSVVTLYERDTREFHSRLELSSEKCTGHRYYADKFDDEGAAYVAGRYCVTDIDDFGNGGLVCLGWEPCDEVAEACVETFDRELIGE